MCNKDHHRIINRLFPWWLNGIWCDWYIIYQVSSPSWISLFPFWDSTNHKGHGRKLGRPRRLQGKEQGLQRSRTARSSTSWEALYRTLSCQNVPKSDKFLKFSRNSVYIDIYRSCRKVAHFWEFRWTQNVSLFSTTVYVHKLGYTWWVSPSTSQGPYHT